MTEPAGKPLIELTAQIVAAHLGHTTTAAAEIPGLIAQVHAAVLRAASHNSDAAPEPLKPAVPVKKSVTPEAIICLEDGKPFKSLKRHLRSQYGMSPEQYRDKWGLPADYPMVAPNYAVERSRLARKMGLGQQRRRRK
jgi:predicted transcriptional regulator